MLETICSSQAYFNSTANLVWSWCIPRLISTNIKILKRDTANYQCLALLKIKQFTNVGIQLRNLLIYANLHFKEISKTKSYSTYPCSIYSQNCCAGVHAVAFLLPQGPATLACLFFPFGSAGEKTLLQKFAAILPCGASKGKAAGPCLSANQILGINKRKERPQPDQGSLRNQTFPRPAAPRSIYLKKNYIRGRWTVLSVQRKCKTCRGWLFEIN